MAAVPAAAGVIGKLGLRDLVRKGVVGTEVVLARHRAQPGCVELPAHPVRDATYAVVGEDVLRLHGEIGSDAVDGAEGCAREAEGGVDAHGRAVRVEHRDDDGRRRAGVAGRVVRDGGERVRAVVGGERVPGDAPGGLRGRAEDSAVHREVDGGDAGVVVGDCGQRDLSRDPRARGDVLEDRRRRRGVAPGRGAIAIAPTGRVAAETEERRRDDGDDDARVHRCRDGTNAARAQASGG